MNAKITPRDIPPEPGCTIIIIPIKPTRIATTRRTFITSPNKKTAKIVINIGVVKLIAVARARGIKVIAKNPANIPILTNTARQTNNPGLFILKVANPELHMTGIIIRQARRFLKKITSIIWILSEAFRIKIPMKLKKKIDIRV